MLQAFKTYLHTLGRVGHEDYPLQLRKRDGSNNFRQIPQDIHYQDVYKALLIAECDESGQERPIAVAFINSQEQGMTIAYLHDLIEVE